ncbi:MAG: Com family DNA-binding transcriptional regulator [Desulfovibrio sp.]
MIKKEFRCGKCNKLLAKGSATEIEIKCGRCRTINYLRTESPGEEDLRVSTEEMNGNEPETLASKAAGRLQCSNI